MSAVLVHIETPYVTISKYANQVGLSDVSIREKVKLGHLPTIKSGKHRLINVALLTKQALEAEI